MHAGWLVCTNDNETLCEWKQTDILGIIGRADIANQPKSFKMILKMLEDATTTAQKALHHFVRTKSCCGQALLQIL